MTCPETGTSIQIHSYKHNGTLHRIWKDSLVLNRTETTVIVANDQTKVVEGDGSTWITKEPAICYFHSQFWFNIIGMLRENGIYFYCNLGSPSVYDSNTLQYIDYDLDVNVYPDMTFDILDKEEYEEHKIEMGYPPVIDHILERNLDELIHWIQYRKGPFSPGFIDEWYARYLTY